MQALRPETKLSATLQDAEDNDPATWASCQSTEMGDCALGYCLWLGPILDVAGIWEMNQQTEDLSYLSLVSK